MKKYVLVYRNEFITEVFADSKDEAINKASSAKWEVLDDLHNDLIEFEDD